jgi:hypothetical protein
MDPHRAIVVCTCFALFAATCLWLYWRERQERRALARLILGIRRAAIVPLPVETEPVIVRDRI